MATYRENGGAWIEFDGEVTALLARLAAEVAADAQRLVPVDTGLLKSRIEAGDVEQTGDVQSVKVHARTHYARWVEMGTSRMRARPYLRPALFRARGGT